MENNSKKLERKMTMEMDKEKWNDLCAAWYADAIDRTLSMSDRSEALKGVIEIARWNDEKRTKKKEFILKTIGIATEVLVGIAVPVTVQLLRDRSYDHMATKFMRYDAEGHIVANPLFKSFVNKTNP